MRSPQSFTHIKRSDILDHDVKAKNLNFLIEYQVKGHLREHDRPDQILHIVASNQGLQ